MEFSSRLERWPRRRYVTGPERADPGDEWLLLHGTPLTPQVRDGVAAHLRRNGPAWAVLTPVAPLVAEGVA